VLWGVYNRDRAFSFQLWVRLPFQSRKPLVPFRGRCFGSMGRTLSVGTEAFGFETACAPEFFSKFHCLFIQLRLGIWDSPVPGKVVKKCVLVSWYLRDCVVGMRPLYGWILSDFSSPLGEGVLVLPHALTAPCCRLALLFFIYRQSLLGNTSDTL